ncbi:hypothetical protein D1007_47122 [Hordeum vulgare]|nr:hypothetical protein D1007_47122 [Hordeum vulgare]
MAETEAVDVAARVAAEEELISVHILKKRQRRNTRALPGEQNRAVSGMAGLPSKDVEEVSDDEDSSGDEQI